MSSTYETYLRNSSGMRSSLVNGITSYKVTFRRNQPAKWELKGTGLTACPLKRGAGIIVIRNGAVLFCGNVAKIQDAYTESTHIYEWIVSGQSDLAKLADRVVYPDPSDSTPDPDGSYSNTGQISAVLRTAINVNAATSALSQRRLSWLSLGSQTNVGDSITLESKFDDLLKLCQDKLEDTQLCLKESWNMSTGKWDVRIMEPNDVSGKVIFSVENGSISEWQRTISAPKANWLLVTGCQNDDDETMSCIVYDSSSISTWGRIEAVVQRSDITRNEDESESWTSVATRLQEAAYEELEKHTATYGYKLTTTEINRNVYAEDYNLGDIVSVRIGSDEFQAQVDEIKITYAKAVEKIVPSVGTMQKGELESVFSEIGTLKEQVKVLQQSK